MAVLSAIGILAVQSPASDSAALYASLASVAVAMIGGAVAVITTGRKPPPEPAIRYIDPPTSNMLPNELSDLLADERRRVDVQSREVDRLRAEVDLWQARAYDSGWRP